MNVIFTTIVYGSFMNLVRKFLLGDEHEEKEEKRAAGEHVPHHEGLLTDY
jgi:hypothetical protein